MPTAVTMLSTEKTMSMRTIWTRRGGQAERRGGVSLVGLVVRIDPLVDLRRRLPDQKQAARQQQQIAHGERMAENGRRAAG